MSDKIVFFPSYNLDLVNQMANNQYEINKKFQENIVNINAIKNNIYAFIYDFPYYKNYLGVDIDSLFNDYNSNIGNYNYYTAIQNIIFSHLNNRTYRLLYDTIADIANSSTYGLVMNFFKDKYKKDIDYTQIIIPQNIKKFIKNIKLDKLDQNNFYLKDGPIEINTIQNEKALIERNNISAMNPYKDVLHEACCGIVLTNFLKKEIPNIPFVYAFMDCSVPILSKTGIISWCNINENNILNTPYILKERVDGEYFLDFLKTCTDEEVSNVYFQFKNYYYFMRKTFKTFNQIFRNHQSAFVIKRLEKDINIRIYNSEYKSNPTNTFFKTKTLLYINDFRNTNFFYEKNNKSKVEFKIILNNNSSEKSFTLDSFESIIIQSGRSVDQNLVQIYDNYEDNNENYNIKLSRNINLNQFCMENYKKSNNTEFKKLESIVKQKIINAFIYYESTYYNKLNDEMLIEYSENYINLLNFLNGSTCFNFIDSMKELYSVYNSITNEINTRINKYNQLLSKNINPPPPNYYAMVQAISKKISIYSTLAFTLKRNVNILPMYNLLGMSVRGTWTEIISGVYQKLISVCMLIIITNSFYGQLASFFFNYSGLISSLIPGLGIFVSSIFQYGMLKSVIFTRPQNMSNFDKLLKSPYIYDLFFGTVYAGLPAITQGLPLLIQTTNYSGQVFRYNMILMLVFWVINMIVNYFNPKYRGTFNISNLLWDIADDFTKFIKRKGLDPILNRIISKEKLTVKELAWSMFTRKDDTMKPINETNEPLDVQQIKNVSIQNILKLYFSDPNIKKKVDEIINSNDAIDVSVKKMEDIFGKMESKNE